MGRATKSCPYGSSIDTEPCLYLLQILSLDRAKRALGSKLRPLSQQKYTLDAGQPHLILKLCMTKDTSSYTAARYQKSELLIPLADASWVVILNKYNSTAVSSVYAGWKWPTFNHLCYLTVPLSFHFLCYIRRYAYICRQTASSNDYIIILASTPRMRNSPDPYRTFPLRFTPKGKTHHCVSGMSRLWRVW
jgi:hypothetical protein